MYKNGSVDGGPGGGEMVYKSQLSICQELFGLITVNAFWRTNTFKSSIINVVYKSPRSSGIASWETNTFSPYYPGHSKT